MSAPTIHGDVDEGFGRVADEFRRNFTERGEIGAAVAVYEGDRRLVDLWAGTRNKKTRAPWQRDTTVVLFSSTKGIAGLAIAAAVSSGVLDYDAPVARYWPEFAVHGKESITVRELIDHRCGLHVIRGRTLSWADLADRELVEQVLVDQRPAWQPGTRQGYQALTLGLYEDALFRRVDPAGRSIGQFVADEFAVPLDVELSVGLSADRDIEDVAQMYRSTPLGMLRHERSFPWPIIFGHLLRRGAFHDTATSPPLGDPWKMRRSETLTNELPSVNGVGNARALARIYGAVAADTGKLPISATVRDQLSGDAPGPAHDAVLGIDTRYHLGLRRSSPRLKFGSPDGRAFGTPGAGGSLGFGDPATGIGFGYTQNRLSLALEDDIRCQKLERSVFSVLG
ncbi:MAG: beta-lactamase family protein [Rhodococcus sp.]|nr:beta-lactamase family protein [Rhodococcus sp. (in: high G+C Gram-positive bacteria)]